jgi:serine protease Do
MKNFGKLLTSLMFVFAGAFVAVWAYSSFFDKPDVITIKEEQPIKYASLADGGASLPDLTFAAEKSVHSVVHIATQSTKGGSWSSGNPFLDDFFGLRQQRPQLATGYGSGVILSEDGFIVSNNHVIEDAQNIKVILNDKREFEAKLIGADPSTDLALLKIDAKGLPILTFGDSDALKLGEWVLAVGNPFNLTSTVTAGIVSAMGRNLGINEDAYKIESFIQTDAAVNPGNSGGALVNQQGNLIGINTAIASRTGSYSGYSFAIPASIVKKVVKDLKEFGEVQRALLGVTMGDVNAEIAKELKLDKIEGVYVSSVTEDGAAKEAGIKKDDIILSVGGVKINSASELQEKISQYRPGETVNVVVNRGGTQKQFNVKLRNRNGNTQVVRSEGNTILGAEFEEVSENEKEKLEIENGVKIKSLKSGKLKEAGVKEGYIVMYVNKKPIYDVNGLKKEISNNRGGILVEGIYPNGEMEYYVFSLK